MHPAYPWGVSWPLAAGPEAYVENTYFLDLGVGWMRRPGRRLGVRIYSLVGLRGDEPLLCCPGSDLCPGVTPQLALDICNLVLDRALGEEEI